MSRKAEIGSEEDRKKARQVAAVVGEYSLEEIMMVMRNHESSNLDDIALTFLCDFNLADWLQKDLQNPLTLHLQQHWEEQEREREKEEREEQEREREKEEREEQEREREKEEREKEEREREEREEREIEKERERENKENERKRENRREEIEKEIEKEMKKDLFKVFEDPITLDIMVNAVQASCGHSFSDHSIRDWLSSHPFCPICSLPLSLGDIVPNYGLRQTIQAFTKHDNQYHDHHPPHHPHPHHHHPHHLHHQKPISSPHPHPIGDEMREKAKEEMKEEEMEEEEKKEEEKKEEEKKEEEMKEEEKKEEEKKEEEKKEEEMEEEEGEITLRKSAQMIPMIREMMEGFDMEEASEEKRREMMEEIKEMKGELERHIDHHLVFNSEANSDLTHLIDTFDHLSLLHSSLLSSLPPSPSPSFDLRLSHQPLLPPSSSSLRGDIPPSDIPHPMMIEKGNEMEKGEKKMKEKREREVREKREREKGEKKMKEKREREVEEEEEEEEKKEEEEEEEKGEEGWREEGWREERRIARQIHGIIGEAKYTLDDILLIMRHHETSKPIDIIELCLAGVNMEEWRMKDKLLLRLSAPKRDCPLCFDEFPITDMFTLDCPPSHRFCYECIQRMVEYSISDGSLPLCPHPLGGGEKKSCGYMISEKEVQQICGTEIYEKYKRILLRVGLMSMKGCMGCPTPGCENWLVVDEEDQRVHCYCDACGLSFCSLCREVYHYHNTSCGEMFALKAKWIKWNAQDRSDVEKDVIDFAICNRRNEIAKRMEEFIADEEWKEQHLRLCPSCSNPIERISGCDAMVCGQNYHGGDVQKGCGASFQWNTAAPYKSSHHHDHLTSVDHLRIDKDDIGRVKADHGEHMLCDVCNKKIVGFRFQCLNCPCYNLCEDCEVVLEHFPAHIFRIFVKPEGSDENNDNVDVKNDFFYDINSGLNININDNVNININNNANININNNANININNNANININNNANININGDLKLRLAGEYQTNWIPPPLPDKPPTKIDRLKKWFARKKRLD